MKKTHEEILAGHMREYIHDLSKVGLSRVYAAMKEYASAYPSQPERVEGVFKVGDTAIVTHEDTNRKYKVGDSFVVAVEYEGDFDDSESGTGQCIGEGRHRGMIWASNCKLAPAAPSAVDWDEIRNGVAEIIMAPRRTKYTPDAVIDYLKNTLTAKSTNQ